METGIETSLCKRKELSELQCTRCVKLYVTHHTVKLPATLLGVFYEYRGVPVSKYEMNGAFLQCGVQVPTSFSQSNWLTNECAFEKLMKSKLQQQPWNSSDAFT